MGERALIDVSSAISWRSYKVAQGRFELPGLAQNRQAEKDRLQTKNDYDVDLKAEMEIMQLHEKLNELRDTYWTDLIRMQQQQIEMLERLVSELCKREQ